MHKPTRQVSTLLSISSHDIACRMVRRSGPHERYLKRESPDETCRISIVVGDSGDGERESTAGEGL